MWENFVKYNSIRTNFLKTFIERNFKAGDPLLPYFLQKYETTGSIFYSWLYIKGLKKEEINKDFSPLLNVKTWDKVRDYTDNWFVDNSIINKLRELFPDMIRSGYSIRKLEEDVPNFSPFSIEEFYKITKGKYYTGQDLDEDLEKMIPFVKEQDLIEEYMQEILFYFKFRYDNFNMSLLCEYSSIPFGVHESRALRYKKTGEIDFEYPREVFKYPVKELFKEKFSGNKEEVRGTRVINIRGTNGSGKTTMVNNIYTDSVEKGKAEECYFMLTDAKGKEHKRYYDLLHDKGLILLGGYNTPFGTKGTDRIGDVYEIIHGILYLLSNYPGWTVIMESATVSTSFWAYALLFKMLQDQGIEIVIVHLWMHDWNFIVNNIKNRTERKQGAKEPDYKGAVDKREILYKNHFRFSSILGDKSCLIMYPDTSTKEDMHIILSEIIKNNTGRGLL